MKSTAPWVTLVAVGVIYVLIGVVFPALYDPPDPGRLRLWRLAAWVVAAAVGLAHIVIEQRRPGSTTWATARRAAWAVAIGGFGLAVSANLHWLAGTRDGRPPLSALPIWPLITGLPVLPVAFVAATLLAWIRRRSVRTPQGS